MGAFIRCLFVDIFGLIQVENHQETAGWHSAGRVYHPANLKMAYVTQNDFINEISEAELAELTGDSTGTTVDSGKLDKAIFDAENLVNGYCSNRYSVPFAAPDIPSLIKTLRSNLHWLIFEKPAISIMSK